MDKVIDLAASSTAQGFHCWGCHSPLSVKALFCNGCGVVQPAREGDHFQRLGLEKRVDINPDLMARNYQQLQRTFAPERFAIRSVNERNYAAKHFELVEIAYTTLHDPIRRGRYWIELHETDDKPNVQPLVPAIVVELRGEFQNARETAELDKVARRTGQEIEFGIMKLLSSLRSQNWNEANKILQALDGMEVLIQEVREKRQSLTPHK